MRKIIRIAAILLAIATISATVVGCGSNTDVGEVDQTESSTINTNSKETENKTNTNIGEFKKQAVISETVMYDENGLKITATGLSYNNYCAELEILIENNSTEDFSIISGSLGYSCNSINGIMISDGYLNSDVLAGKKANETIDFDYDSLMFCGIDEIADIEIGFEIIDDANDSIYTGPIQLKTSIANEYEYNKVSFEDIITNDTYQNVFDYSVEYFNSQEVYNDSGINITSSCVIVNNSGEKSLILETNNNSDTQLGVSIGDITVNGLTIIDHTWSYDLINAGKKNITDINLSNVLENNLWDIYGITDISDISFEISISDKDDNVISKEKEVFININDKKFTIDTSGTEVYSNNGIRIISKGIVESDSKYSDDLYVMLLVENTSTKDVVINEDYGSFSINGIMSDCSFYSVEAKANKYSIFKIKLWDYELEDVNIISKDDITEIEMGIEINDSNWNDIDSAKIKISY